MAADSPELFDIFLTGSVEPPAEPATVAARLAELFRIAPARAAQLLAGKPQRVKAGVDRATALRYRDALRGTGAGFAIRSSSISASSSPAAASPPISAPVAAASASADTALTLADAGAPLLSDAERSRPPLINVDTSAIALAPAFLSATEPSDPPPAPDTSHLQVNPPGELLAASERPPEAPAVSAPAFTLAEAGALLDTLDDRPPPLAPLIDHLDLAPAGADLLTAAERPAPAPPYQPAESQQWRITPT